MAGEDSDGHEGDGYIPEDPHFFPKFDFDDENDSDNFGFSNILHPDQYDEGGLVGEANPNENYFDGRHLGYLPKSPDFFIDINSDMETEINTDEFRELLRPHEHDARTLVENAANPNENHFDEHDVGYVPQEPILPQQIHIDQGIAPFVFEFSHPKEHDDADTLIEEDANLSENYSHGHEVGDFPTDYHSQEHIIEEHHVEGNMIGNFATSEQHGSENDFRGNRTEKWPGWPGQNIFRLLVPVKQVGCIIGPKGEYIKKIIEETMARIKVLSGPPGITERAVLISAREVPHCTVPPAVKGLLRVHEQVLNDTASITSGAVCSIITRLLVPDSQGRSLIGKQGFTIKSIQEYTGCIIRVLRSGSRPVFALEDDSVVEIHGESAGVHKAVELIALHLRKFLVDHSIIGMQRLDVQVNNNMIQSQTWGLPPLGVPENPVAAAGGHDFASNHQYMPHFNHYGNYYHLPQDPSPAYATDSSMEVHSSSVEPKSSVETKDTQYMQIPMSYADAVFGASGANISYIRSASGASVTIRETEYMPGLMTVEISGTSSEIQTAELLVQNFLAGATCTEHDHIEGSNSRSDSSYAPSESSGAGDHTNLPSQNDVPLDGTTFGH
ncbi:hypothetical protein TanjilG_18632 [Lupinus angustifolius]|uniref:K Homology domain-containing protein n=1 Tax=Lupinus angustifolius TaxID=3871 RepID=A0A1J7HRK2_LUPAN|nr:hypothetical protein TanjilG_18632 [Lupinus angustifolius]